MLHSSRGIFLIFFLALFGVACGAEPSTTNDRDGGSGGGDLGDPPSQSGVVFVAHYFQSAQGQDYRLIWYRVDGEVARLEGELDLGSTSLSMAADRENQVLAVVSDVERSVALYQLDLPTSADDESGEPSLVGRINFENETPLFADFDPARQRLYVSVSPSTGGLVTENLMYIYDVSSPSDPALLSGAPYSVPVTAAWDIDPVRHVMWLIDFQSDELVGYDLTDNGLEEIPGGGVDLRVDYPGENQSAFQARDLTVDPYRNRIYAARSQGPLSELIAFDYPAFVPEGTGRYGEQVDMSRLQSVSDGFDVSQSSDDSPSLLDAFEVSYDFITGDVFMSGNAWDGDRARALVAGLSPSSLELQPGCSATSGFGCWAEEYINGAKGFKKQTDGALCVDATHKVVALTSLADAEEDPGEMHFFKYQSDGSATAFLDERGDTLVTSSFPVSALCL